MIPGGPERTRPARTHARQPARTCVGCRESTSPEHAVRVVLGSEGELVVDLAGKSFGRGAWLHPELRCLESAVKGGLARSFRTAVRTSVDELRAGIRLGAERRMQGLLVAARNARALVTGADATQEAAARGELGLVIVARDAGSVAKKEWLASFIASGKAVAWGDKAALGALLGRGETALLGVFSDRFSAAMQETASLWSFASTGVPSIGPSVSVEDR